MRNIFGCPVHIANYKISTEENTIFNQLALHTKKDKYDDHSVGCLALGRDDILDIQEFTSLKQFINHQLKFYCSVLGLPAHLELLHFWFNNQPFGSSRLPHCHTMHQNGKPYQNKEQADLVLVMHLTSHQKGFLRFHYPKLKHYQGKTLQAFTPIDYAPQAGRLFVFPPWLVHEVCINEDHRNRLSIGANYRIMS